MGGFFCIMDNAGLSSEVQQALQRRSGAPTPQLGQVSPDARMQNPVAPPSMTSSSMQSTSNPPAAQESQSEKFIPKTQEDLIIQALISQLKSSGSLKKEILKMSEGGTPPTPPMPNLAQTPPTDSFLGAPSMAVSDMQGGYPLSGGI